MLYDKYNFDKLSGHITPHIQNANYPEVEQHFLLIAFCCYKEAKYYLTDHQQKKKKYEKMD